MDLNLEELEALLAREPMLLPVPHVGSLPLADNHSKGLARPATVNRSLNKAVSSQKWLPVSIGGGTSGSDAVTASLREPWHSEPPPAERTRSPAHTQIQPTSQPQPVLRPHEPASLSSPLLHQPRHAVDGTDAAAAAAPASARGRGYEPSAPPNHTYEHGRRHEHEPPSWQRAYTAVAAGRALHRRLSASGKAHCTALTHSYFLSSCADEHNPHRFDTNGAATAATAAASALLRASWERPGTLELARDWVRVSCVLAHGASTHWRCHVSLVR